MKMIPGHPYSMQKSNTRNRGGNTVKEEGKTLSDIIYEREKEENGYSMVKEQIEYVLKYLDVTYKRIELRASEIEKIEKRKGVFISKKLGMNYKTDCTVTYEGYSYEKCHISLHYNNEGNLEKLFFYGGTGDSKKRILQLEGETEMKAYLMEAKLKK